MVALLIIYPPTSWCTSVLAHTFSSVIFYVPRLDGFVNNNNINNISSVVGPLGCVCRALSPDISTSRAPFNKICVTVQRRLLRLRLYLLLLAIKINMLTAETLNTPTHSPTHPPQV